MCIRDRLFIDELHTIIGAGGAEGALDASNILKPALARGDVQVIAVYKRQVSVHAQRRNRHTAETFVSGG